MEELKAEIAIIKQTQDDINGYLNSLTTEIDLLKANYEELKAYVSNTDSELTPAEEIRKIRVEIEELRKILAGLSL